MPAKASWERKEVAECLHEFRSAKLDRRQFLWELAHKRWLTWQFNRASHDTHLFAINVCQLDYAIVGYATECMDQVARDAAVEAIRGELQEVDGLWHQSVINVYTEWNRLSSKLQPYIHASMIATSGEDWLMEQKTYPPFDPKKDRYLALKYGAQV